MLSIIFFFFFSSRRRHTRYWRDWSSDVCSSDLEIRIGLLIAQNREEFATTIGLVVVFGDDTFGNIQKQDIRLHIRLLPLGHNPLLVIQRNEIGRASCRERV